MYHLRETEWPFRFVTRDEYDRFVADMDHYYHQLSLRATRPPSLDELAGSPSPFFFEMKHDRGDLAGVDPAFFMEAYKNSDEFDGFRLDVLTHFERSRLSTDRLTTKGGGFSCRNN